MNSIFAEVEKLVSELSHVSFALDDGKITDMKSALGALPRSGKSVRIDAYNLSLPKQSVLDHILHLGFITDIFFKKLNWSIDRESFISRIVFHDLPEILTGDYPDFSNNPIFGVASKGRDVKENEELEASKKISEILSGELKLKFELYMKDEDSKDIPVFKFVDKIEPIISIWRYVYVCKNGVGNKIDIESYLNAMSDFFINPDVVAKSLDKTTLDLINFLQNKENLKKYYFENTIGEVGIFTEGEIRQLIEGREMLFV